jgi:mRNA interferase MazF
LGGLRPPPLRWAMVFVDLDPVQGHEQGGERRGIIVSYEPLHTGGMVAMCPVTAQRSLPKYPNEVGIPLGEAGQTRAGVILCHQVRTISLQRVQSIARVRGVPQYLTDATIRAAVRRALARHLGLDIPGDLDGASTSEAYA